MFRNHYTTIAAWIIVYISLWLSRDNLVSSKFSKNNCHTGFVSRIIETMIFPFQWYKNRPTYEYVVGLVLLCCINRRRFSCCGECCRSGRRWSPIHRPDRFPLGAAPCTRSSKWAPKARRATRRRRCRFYQRR